MADGSIRFPSLRRAAPRPASPYRRTSARRRGSANRGSQVARLTIGDCGLRIEVWQTESRFCVRRWKLDVERFRTLGELDVLARIHLKVERQEIFRVRLNDFFVELHEDRIFAKDSVFVHRLKIDGDEEWPVRFGVDPLPALDTENLRNFQKLHPSVHHTRFHAGRRDLGLELIEDDMMNHER